MKSSIFSKVSTRFVSEKAVINALTKDGKNTLPAELSEVLCQDLGCPSGTGISKITPVITKGVGSTQCKPYILHLNNGMQYFMKQTPGTNNSDIKQREADEKITRALGEDNTHPFVKMTCATKTSEGNLFNGILFFPFVPGDNLFLTLQKNINNTENKKAIFTAIGDALAIVHNNCLKHAEHESIFSDDGNRLRSVLVHDDWQATNIMITPDLKAVIVDTEGTGLSSKSSRNIIESWEFCANDQSLMKCLLEGYIKRFPEDRHEKLRNILVNELENKYQIKFTEYSHIAKPM